MDTAVECGEVGGWEEDQPDRNTLLLLSVSGCVCDGNARLTLPSSTSSPLCYDMNVMFECVSPIWIETFMNFLSQSEN
jgi:hypothetical protein